MSPALAAFVLALPATALLAAVAARRSSGALVATVALSLAAVGAMLAVGFLRSDDAPGAGIGAAAALLLAALAGAGGLVGASFRRLPPHDEHRLGGSGR